MAKVKRFLPLGIILVLMATVYLLNLKRFISLEIFQDLNSTHPIITPLIFVLIYIASTALSLPIGSILTIFAGLLFGMPYAPIYVVIGATVGASIIFWATRTAFAPSLKKKANPYLKKLRKGFAKNETNYMLFLRLAPIFPFWLINIAPALLNVRFFTYVWTTAVGIIPGTYIYAQAGAILSTTLTSQEPLTIASILTLKMRLILIAMGLLALLPIVVKKIRDRH